MLCCRQDYWLSWMHKQFVGTRVLNVTSENRPNTTRVYAHCAKYVSNLFTKNQGHLFRKWSVLSLRYMYLVINKWIIAALWSCWDISNWKCRCKRFCFFFVDFLFTYTCTYMHVGSVLVFRVPIAGSVTLFALNVHPNSSDTLYVQSATSDDQKVLVYLMTAPENDLLSK